MDPTLQSAYDLHVHCAPDVVPRVQDAFDLARDACEAGMAGVGLKDHTTSTVGRAHVLNRIYDGGPTFYSSIVLNPPVGGLNPAAVESALASGCDIVYFPTYAARHHVRTLGPDVSPVPHPREGVVELTVLSGTGDLKDEVRRIIDLIAEHDAVLATGHLSPEESLILLASASAAGVKRMIVTHASESVPAMSVADQRTAVECGAMIEHSFLAVTPCCPGTVSMEAVRDQIRAVGTEHCVLSSDFGQIANGPPVAAFGEHVRKLARLGFGEAEMREMIVVNPGRLMQGRGDA